MAPTHATKAGIRYRYRAAVEGRLPRGVNIARLRDAPAEWSRQFEALGLTPRRRECAGNGSAQQSRIRRREPRPPGTGFLDAETRPPKSPKETTNFRRD
jgi:hypothetical protein